MSISVCRTLLVFVVAACAIGCGQVDAPGSTPGGQPAAQTSAPADPVPAAAAAPEPRTVADIFPPGPQREAVINNCGSCHNLACAAIGQRSAERWDALEAGHKEQVPNTDLNGMFEYLKANFNSTRPEPRIPPKFLEGGCTPF